MSRAGNVEDLSRVCSVLGSIPSTTKGQQGWVRMANSTPPRPVSDHMVSCLAEMVPSLVHVTGSSTPNNFDDVLKKVHLDKDVCCQA